MAMQIYRNSRGFTLVEVMLAGVIGVSAWVAVDLVRNQVRMLDRQLSTEQQQLAQQALNWREFAAAWPQLERLEHAPASCTMPAGE
ncbi:prepilin-type N-terminal cleavage/methylation domain-containing protein [Aliidiomarina celeris]|uniref:prepilin-type N-terminal cleavage/methylation domain-containing protein n=1 Tax=Aliidiomarina celeris TaxID=2249428 RepID=UPI000DE91849|nr:prepilin-type N-terminal cleavage/methylation domain-containing protein [Aliidiomarina celeris]